MKYNKLKYFVFAGLVIASLGVSYAFNSIQSVIPDRLQAGGIGPFIVTGGPPSSVTLKDANHTGIALCNTYSMGVCGDCVCDPMLSNGQLTLTVGDTYYFSSAALIAISNQCGGGATNGVQVNWGSIHATDLCMHIQCGGGGCSYSGATGSVTLS